MRKMKQRKKSKNRTGKICISCMVVVLTLIMSVQIGHLYQVNEGYKQDEKTKQAQLKDEQERSTELQEKEAFEEIKAFSLTLNFDSSQIKTWHDLSGRDCI